MRRMLGDQKRKETLLLNTENLQALLMYLGICQRDIKGQKSIADIFTCDPVSHASSSM